ncbi:hypothetical protein [Mycobacterium sp.]|uniref:hypothetical protein n=1 Tax=Mycobacterium sp. TaxID=1785 RepID=UPI001283E4FF|nr:hypothetical protein [Mycobacterium sp.]KAA8959064.1 MAG: hypothetical protein F6Q13_14765 [Mycobacterium sp.]
MELLTNNATLSDPGDTLGLGTSPIAGEWLSEPATLSSVGSFESFSTPDALLSASYLMIQDNWLPGLEFVGIQTGRDNDLLAFLVPVDGGKHMVDLVNFGAGDVPPLVNPDATGPIDVGGVQQASPQDGALLNDLAGALFQGETADWSKATTLFADLLGTDPPDASAAMADSGAAAASGAAELLSQAGANLAEAQSAITMPLEVSTTTVLDLLGNLGAVVTGGFEAGIGTGMAKAVVDQLQSAESIISAHDGGLSTQVAQLFFDPLNQDWVTTSAALLHADQAFEGALTSGSGFDTADASLFTVDLQVFGDVVNSLPFLDVANLVNLF